MPALQPLGMARSNRKRISPSTLDKEEDIQPREQMEPRKSPHSDYGGLTAAEFGTQVHAAWEEITWLGAHPAPAWMTDDAARTLPQSVVYHALQQPEIAALFTRRPGQEVYNEQSLEAITDKNEWMSATIDRLVLTVDAGGTPTAAHIIDFKTNQLTPTENEPEPYEGLRKEYAAQMAAYKKLICQAFNLPPESVAVSLISCPREYELHPARLLTGGILFDNATLPC